MAQVGKRLFGREGANMMLLGAGGETLAPSDGPYGHHKLVYQERAHFARDGRGDNYQAGVFFVGEACGLGFRRGGDILDDRSKFVGHLIA